MENAIIINNLVDCLQRSQEFLKEYGEVSSELDNVTDDMILADDIKKSIEDCHDLYEQILKMENQSSIEKMLIYMINTYTDEKYGAHGIYEEVKKDIMTATGMTEDFFQSIKNKLDFIPFSTFKEAIKDFELLSRKLEMCNAKGMSLSDVCDELNGYISTDGTWISVDFGCIKEVICEEKNGLVEVDYDEKIKIWDDFLGLDIADGISIRELKKIVSYEEIEQKKSIDGLIQEAKDKRMDTVGREVKEQDKGISL